MDPALAEEVSAAYEHYWQVRAEALYDLEPSLVPDIAAGDHLDVLNETIQNLRQEGRAIRTDVGHHYAVVEATNIYAQIIDQYTERSVYVDAQSHEELTLPSEETITEGYEMRKIDGTWRVTGLARAP